MLRAGYRTPSLQHMSYLLVLLLLCMHCEASYIFHRGCSIARFLCAYMRIFDVWGSSSTPRLPECQILILPCPPRIAELVCREKLRTQSITQSLTHPAYLIRREPKLLLRNKSWTNRKIPKQAGTETGNCMTRKTGIAMRSRISAETDFKKYGTEIITALKEAA